MTRRESRGQATASRGQAQKGSRRKAREEARAEMRELRERVGTLSDWEGIYAVTSLDAFTGGVPPRGQEAHGRRLSLVDNQLARGLKDPRMLQLVSSLDEPGPAKFLSNTDRAIVRFWKPKCIEACVFDADDNRRNVDATSNASFAWQKARTKNSYEEFKPALDAVLKEKVYRAGKLQKVRPEKRQPYEHMLREHFGADLRVKDLDAMFSRIRGEIVPLFHAIQQKKARDPERHRFGFLDKKVRWDVADGLARKIATDIGFSLDRGTFAYVEHPMMQNVASPRDARVCMARRPGKTITLREAVQMIMAAMHEAGHGMFEQGADYRLEGTGLAAGALDLHESQSRIWEVMVGKGKPFWKHYFPKLQKIFPRQLKGVTLDEFYRAINQVEGTGIRIRADELTYNLHVMLRYGLEKEMAQPDPVKRRAVLANLPKRWNAEMERNLGYKVKDDKDGVLQDIHWSAGLLGYFPTYTRGNVIAAQLYNKARKDIPELEQQLAQGRFAPFRSWLRKNVHRGGQKETTDQVVRRVTGEPVNPDYMINYQKEKFKALYEL